MSWVGLVSATDLRKNSVVKYSDVAPVDGSEASTRRRIFASIMAQGNMTAVQLAALLGITPTAVRRHLDSLEAEGLIQARAPRRNPSPGRGRPAKVFQITDVGRDQFHQAYGELAVQAIAQLVAAVGPDGLSSLAKAHFWPIEASFDAIKSSHPGEAVTDVLVAAFRAGGYVAEISHMTSGEQFCQHHCPVADVARQFPQLCEIETKLIAQLLDSHVQRLATIAHGDGVCTTHIPVPVGHPTQREES